MLRRRDPDPECGFADFFGTLSGACSYYDPATLRRGETDASDETRDPRFFYTDAITDHAVEFIARQADAGWDELRARRLDRLRAEGLLGTESALSAREPTQPSWEAAPHQAWEARRMQVYAAQAERMDRGIGRILDQLAASGVRDDTIVVFLSDNGGCAEELPLGDP